jgi:type II secretory pathway pseudopilin PulG
VTAALILAVGVAAFLGAWLVIAIGGNSDLAAENRELSDRARVAEASAAHLARRLAQYEVDLADAYEWNDLARRRLARDATPVHDDTAARRLRSVLDDDAAVETWLDGA